MDFIKVARDRLEEEAQRIEVELRVKLPKEINAAMAHGDLSENAEYHAAKERQSTLQARMAQIQKRLADLSRIDVSSIGKERVGLGSEVTVENLDTGEMVRYTLVIPEVADGKKNLVSVASPVGRALLNRKVGDSVTVSIPKGTCELEVRKFVTIFGDVFE
ncbi:MAG: transcription elongation factor GreA [Deltaproteobacteria bacterium]|nr:transcription elongation factor GreA [Deltaproteobacteria bacterium]